MEARARTPFPVEQALLCVKYDRASAVIAAVGVGIFLVAGFFLIGHLLRHRHDRTAGLMGP